MLRSELGEAEPAERVELEQVVVPAPRPLPAEIAAAVGPAAVLDGREHRVRRAAGRSYPDLIRMRSGRIEVAPRCRPGAAGCREPTSPAVLAACAAAGGSRSCRSEAAPAWSVGSSPSEDPSSGSLRSISDGDAFSRGRPHLDDYFVSVPACADPRPRRCSTPRDSRSGTFRSPPPTRPSAATRPPARPVGRRAAMGDSTRWPPRSGSPPRRATANARDPAHRGRPFAARARPRLRRNAWGDHASDRTGPAPSGAPPLRGVVGGGLHAGAEVAR